MAELSLLAKATLVLGVALMAARLVHRAPASVRALVLASGFAVLLALPIAALLIPHRTIEIPIAYNAAPMAFFVEDVSQPAALGVLRVTPASDARRRTPLTAPSVSTLLRAAWALGSLLCVAPLVMALVRLRRMRRRGRPWSEGSALVRTMALQMGVRRRVDVLLHEDLAAPMTCGLFHPSVALPVDAPRWNDTELRQAIVHELEHVRRGDWAIHLVARVGCAIYWFHPLAWMAWRQLCLESERACDDAVLGGAEQTAYAEQLVSLARRLSKRTPAPLLSMADRSNLSTRVTAVLDRHQARGHAGTAATIAIVSSALAVAATISPLQAINRLAESDDTRQSAPERRPTFDVASTKPGLQPARRPVERAVVEDAARPSPNDAPEPAAQEGQPPAATAPAFEVASIKRNTSGTPGFSGGLLPGGRLVLGNSPTGRLIRMAYPTPTADIVGAPGWVMSERYDVTAIADPDATRTEMQAMLRTLLAERFKLTVHYETEERPVYALVLARSDGRLGPGMRRTEFDCAEVETAVRRLAPVKPASNGAPACGMTSAGGTMRSGGITMALLATLISDAAGRLVVDKTGLDGSYEFALRYSVQPTSGSAAGVPQVGDDPPSIFTALQEQLGLKLEPDRAPLQVLVIDHIERPTEN